MINILMFVPLLLGCLALCVDGESISHLKKLPVDAIKSRAFTALNTTSTESNVTDVQIYIDYGFNGTFVDVTNPSKPPFIIGVSGPAPPIDPYPLSNQSTISADPGATSKLMRPKRQALGPPNYTSAIAGNLLVAVWIGAREVAETVLKNVLSQTIQGFTEQFDGHYGDQASGNLHIELYDYLSREWNFWLFEQPDFQDWITWEDVGNVIINLVENLAEHESPLVRIYSGLAMEQQNLVATASLTYIGG